MRPPSQGEALAVWALLALDVVAILVVYSVLDPAELYHTSERGLEGGLGRALVQLNFPSVAGVAIPITLLALDVLPRRAWVAGVPAIALCAVFAWPGVVDEDDLDAKTANAIPALGVALALLLTILAARRAGAGFAPSRSGDAARLVAAACVVVLSLPWLSAESGFHLPGDVFLGEEAYAEPGEAATAAVHLGHHHGLMGALLVLSALLLSRPRLVGHRLGQTYSLLLSLMLAYGAANLAQDFWHEQVVKRGWTASDIPGVTTPGLTPMWGLVLVATVALFALGFARRAEVAEPAIIA